MSDRDTRQRKLEHRLDELKEELITHFGDPSFGELDAEFRDVEAELRSLREQSIRTESNHQEPVKPRTEASIPQTPERASEPLYKLFGFRRKV